MPPTEKDLSPNPRCCRGEELSPTAPAGVLKGCVAEGIKPTERIADAVLAVSPLQI